MLAVCLVFSLAPWSYADQGGPSYDQVLRNLGRHWQNRQTSEGAAPLAPNLQVIATGLDGPRGLTFGPDGGIYVAESGTGGTACYQLDPNDPSSTFCIGTTGAVTRIENGVQERIATGLPSMAGPDGSGAMGPTRLSWRARDGFSVVIGGLAFLTEMRDDLVALNPLFGDMGKLVRMNPAGTWSYMADLMEYEFTANPHLDSIDTNAYTVFSAPGRKRIVADAGGNDLLEVDNNGNIRTLAVFPNRMVEYPPMFGGGIGPMQAVPTTVTQGPDGAYYVGQLTGFPFPVGGANVYRVIPGSQPNVYASGFSAIHDITFGPDGSLYVLQFDDDLMSCELFGACTGGRLIRVAPNGTRTTIAQNLPLPGGVAVNKNGEVYITLFSILPGMGQVVKVQ